MTMMAEALANATDTKACVVGPGAADGAAAMFRKLFPSAAQAIIIEDPRTKSVAGDNVASRLNEAGVEVSEYVVNPDGSDFHATYEKVGIGTLFSTKVLEFILRRDLSKLDVEKAVAMWPFTFDALKATFPAIYGGRPAHIRRAEGEMAKKYSTPDRLREELSAFRRVWPEFSERLRAQLMPFGEVREKLRLSGAPYEPEHIGIARSRFRETCLGVPYMRNRYFALDLVERLGLMDELLGELFGPAGIWEISDENCAQGKRTEQEK